MTRQAAVLIMATLIGWPLQAQQDAARRQSDSLRVLLRPIVRNRDQIRVVLSDGSFVVRQPGVWLDTLSRPDLIVAVQVLGRSTRKAGMIGGTIGFVGGAVLGVTAGAALSSDFGTDANTSMALGGFAVGIGGAIVGMGVGALIGATIPSWHTRISVGRRGRIELRQAGHRRSGTIAGPPASAPAFR